MLVLRLHLHKVMHCIVIFNCPQTKFAKVMFLHLSVSHSVHGGGRAVPGQVPLRDQVHPLAGPGTPPGTRYIHQAGTGQVSPWDQVPSPTPPGTRYTPLQVPPQAVHAGRYGQQADGTHPTGMHSCSIYIKN